MELQLKIVGWGLMALALVHVIFPRYFKWKEEMPKISLINRELLYVHTFFIAVLVFLMGLFCLTSSSDIVHTSLGKRIALGFAIFWSLRLLVQFFGYSSELWKGKTFETIVHIIFIILWFYLSFLFFWIYIN